MPEYRRWQQPGGMFFLTLATFERRPLFAHSSNVDLLWSAIQFVQQERPFELTAYVIMPDHLHWLVKLPEGDTDYSTRVGRVKALFTKEHRMVNGGQCLSYANDGGRCPPYMVYGSRSASRAKHRERDVWQRRFWEHTIRDDDDFRRHVEYVHYNPVKHGLTGCPHEWKESSFALWVKERIYDRNWCCQCHGRSVKRPDLSKPTENFGE